MSISFPDSISLEHTTSLQNPTFQLAGQNLHMLLSHSPTVLSVKSYLPRRYLSKEVSWSIENRGGVKVFSHPKKTAVHHQILAPFRNPSWVAVHVYNRAWDFNTKPHSLLYTYSMHLIMVYMSTTVLHTDVSIWIQPQKAKGFVQRERELCTLIQFYLSTLSSKGYRGTGLTTASHTWPKMNIWTGLWIYKFPES